jgi:hypothetical protein
MGDGALIAAMPSMKPRPFGRGNLHEALEDETSVHVGPQ